MAFTGLLLIIVLLCSPSPCATAQPQAELSPTERAAADLRSWAVALEMARVDRGQYPTASSIEELAFLIQDQGYWESPVVLDPWGQPYRCSSSGGSFRVWSAGPDGRAGSGDDLEATASAPAPIPRLTPTSPAPRTRSAVARAGRSVGNSLTATKVDGDVVLSWSATGTTYDVVGATSPGFENPYSLSQQTGTSFTCQGALSNGRDAEWFDVTDETETNRGADSGGYLPPQPPVLDPLPGGGVFAIGQSVSLTGSSFSEVVGDNLVCLAGGVCFHPDSVAKSASQLTFVLPPAALSGTVSVALGTLQSASVPIGVQLNSSSLSILRGIGFASRPGGGTGVGGEYWVSSNAGGNHVSSYSYDSGTGAWVGYPRDGPYTGVHYLSTKTDRFQALYAAYGTQASSGSSRRMQTDPPADMALCVNLGSGTGNMLGLGAAPDPNPAAVAGRDVVYFALQDNNGPDRIRKVTVDAGGCLAMVDTNFGNRSWNWPSAKPVGMSVDESTGDLYVSEGSAIMKVTPGGSVSTFKGGFSEIWGLDVWHEPGGSFAAILVADHGAGTVSVVPLDSMSSDPRVIATSSDARSVLWSRSTFSPTAWTSAGMNRVAVAHTSGGFIMLRPAPVISSKPYEEAAHLWISAPDPADRPTFQGVVRPSYPPSTDFSTLLVKAWWEDGVGRELCATLGDAPTSAPYEPQPISAKCWIPWTAPAGGRCDNQEDFVAGGVGSSKRPMPTDPFEECESNCGDSAAHPCEFEFRISQRYAGDNYRVYLHQPGSSAFLRGAVYTAWKRVYVEHDRMARRGGMLWENPAFEPDAWVGQDHIYIAKDNATGPPDGRMDNMQANDIIHIFDTATPYEDPSHDVACVLGDPIPGPDYFLVNLGSAIVGGICTGPAYPLTHDYDASVPNPLTGQWDFDVGGSAGVAVEGQGVFFADPSALNNRNGIPGTFDDAFTSFKAPPSGAGVVPYLPLEWFVNHAAPGDYERFSQIWFENRRPDTSNPPDNLPNNYFHLLGASSRTEIAGSTRPWSDLTVVFDTPMEEHCTANSDPAPDWQTCLESFVVDTTNHELAHEFEVNSGGLCSGGHDPIYEGHPDNLAWCSPACVDPNPIMSDARCIMSNALGAAAELQWKDAVHRMDCEDLGSLDPIPPDTDPCDLDDCLDGVRNQWDPH